MYYTIYKITNQINGKFYIGSHKTLDLNDDYMGSGKYLLHAQKKYGMENFTKEILFIFETAEEMYQKEAELVNEEMISLSNTYNVKIGGFGGWDYINSNQKNLYGNNGKVGFGGENLKRGGSLSQETRDKISATLKAADYKPFLGKKHTTETKQLLSSKMSVSQAGEKNSQFGTRWIHCKTLQVSKRISKEAPLPENWEEGRKIKF